MPVKYGSGPCSRCRTWPAGTSQTRIGASPAPVMAAVCTRQRHVPQPVRGKELPKGREQGVPDGRRFRTKVTDFLRGANVQKTSDRVTAAGDKCLTGGREHATIRPVLMAGPGIQALAGREVPQ